MDKKKNFAATITADWESTGASTIAPKEVKKYSSDAPVFGVLDEKGGRKLYAFLGMGNIKKLVIPIVSGTLQDKEHVCSKLEESGFQLLTLHRAKAKGV